MNISVDNYCLLGAQFHSAVGLYSQNPIIIM